MKYVLNGESKTSDVGLNLKEALQASMVNIPSGIAVAVDDEIIPKKQWESCTISENQKILVITATQGG